MKRKIREAIWSGQNRGDDEGLESSGNTTNGIKSFRIVGEAGYTFVHISVQRLVALRRSLVVAF